MNNHTLRNYYFIINPAAGKGNLQSKLIQQIRNTLPMGSYHIYCTTGVGDGERYADQIVAEAAAHHQDIVLFACGGDGTLFEVINGVKGRVPIGVIPCGSGNDFVKNIVLENRAQLLDISAQINGTAQPLDLIRCNDVYIANVCDIGFDADVAYNMTRFKRLPFVSGKLAYILSALYCLMHPMGVNLTVQIDDQPPIHKAFLFAVIANGQIYGGSFKAAPLASVNDGLIDVCLCKKITRCKLMRFIIPYQKGTYLNMESAKPIVQYEKCQRLHIQAEQPFITAYDGNITTETSIDIEIVPAALQLIVPQGATLK